MTTVPLLMACTNQTFATDCGQQHVRLHETDVRRSQLAENNDCDMQTTVL